MSLEPALATALARAGLPVSIQGRRPLAGGCIHPVEWLEPGSGAPPVVAKIGRPEDRPLFEAEAESLRRLAATGAVRVPEVLALAGDAGRTILLLEGLAPGRAEPASWREFGERLAALHTADAGSRYGFERDNHLGRTPQPNPWCDDWVTFIAEHRLGHQLALARRRGALGAAELGAVERVIERLDRLIPRHPHPALLHGDLWAGNAHPTPIRRGSETEIALLDPACFVGDTWAEIAMMKLFGGFPACCFEAYEAIMPDAGQVEARVAVYQLYHLLNHANLFGGGYAGRAAEVARALA